MTGPQQSTGVQITAAMRLYQALHGDTVAGKKVEIVLRDDGAISDNSKRLAQELIVNQKVNFVVGFGLTPNAFAVAPLATKSKSPMVVMAAGTSSITERSPYIVRTSFTLPQSSVIMAQWALKNGIKKVVSMVSDFAPGIDSENLLQGGLHSRAAARFRNSSASRSPIRTSRRSCSAPATPSPTPCSSSCRRGRARSSSSSSSSAASTRPASRSSAPATCTDDDVLNGMGDAGDRHRHGAHLLGRAIRSPMNKAYVAAFQQGQQRRAAELHVGRRL